MVSLTNVLAVGAALCAMGANTADALDKTLYGVNFDLRRGPDWDPSKCKTADTIASQLKTLSTITKRVRTYALSDCDVSPVLTSAKSLGMTVWLGVWVSADEAVYAKELETAQKLLDAGLIDSNVVGFNVGSEAVYRKDITAEQAISYLNDFKKWLKKNSLTQPVAITDIIDTMIAYPDIVAASDVVTINQFPFWEKIAAGKAAAQFKSRIQPLLKLAGSRDVYITETGWPTGGQSANASVASEENAARYLNDFYQLATSQNWKYYYFQAFDSEWKAELEGEADTVEASFGIFKSTGVMKTAYNDLKFTDLSSSEDAASGTSSASGGSSATTDGESGSSSSSTLSKKPTTESGSSADTTTDAGPGTVSAGSTGDVDTSGVSKKNSSSSNSSTPSATKSAATGTVASALSFAIVIVSAALASL